MEPSARVAERLDQQPLDEAVDIFVGSGDERWIGSAALEQLPERRVDLARFVARQHAGVRQRAGPRQAAGHVVFKEAAIEAKRRAEFEGGGIGCRIEASGPEISHESRVERRSSVVSRWS